MLKYITLINMQLFISTIACSFSGHLNT